MWVRLFFMYMPHIKFQDPSIQDYFPKSYRLSTALVFTQNKDVCALVEILDEGCQSNGPEADRFCFLFTWIRFD